MSLYLLLNTPEAKRFKPYLEGKLILLSFQSVAEFRFIACRRNWGARRMAELESILNSMVLVNYEADMATMWAALMCAQTNAGRSIGVADAWIAATAILTGATLLTNDRDFHNVPGINVLRAMDNQ